MSRRRLAAGVFLVLVVTLPAAATRVNPLGSIRTWAVYYGDAPETADDLARFDLVVIDPVRHPPWPAVKQHGAIVLAYASLGEVNVDHPAYAEIKDAPWVLDANPRWPDARRLDPRGDAYERWLLDRVVAGALSGPVHGLFLDTADTALELERADPARYIGAADALDRILRAVRSRHPRAVLVLNGGLPLAARVGAALDGVALESVWTDYDFAAKQYRRRDAVDADARAAALAAVARGGVRPLTLEYAEPDDAAWIADLLARSRARGFVPYIATLALDRVFTASLDMGAPQLRTPKPPPEMGAPPLGR
jgi:uncharacterized protein (TIGR01370 family)